jgi:quinoprotein glucose dehydrogenase
MHLFLTELQEINLARRGTRVPSSDAVARRCPHTTSSNEVAPFDLQGISPAKLIDFTEPLRLEALRFIQAYRWDDSLYAAVSHSRAFRHKGTLLLPGILGGANWQSGALDPESGFACRLQDSR